MVHGRLSLVKLLLVAVTMALQYLRRDEGARSLDLNSQLLIRRWCGVLLMRSAQRTRLRTQHDSSGLQTSVTLRLSECSLDQAMIAPPYVRGIVRRVRSGLILPYLVGSESAGHYCKPTRELNSLLPVACECEPTSATAEGSGVGCTHDGCQPLLWLRPSICH